MWPFAENTWWPFAEKSKLPDMKMNDGWMPDMKMSNDWNYVHVGLGISLVAIVAGLGYWIYQANWGQAGGQAEHNLGGGGIGGGLNVIFHQDFLAGMLVAMVFGMGGYFAFECGVKYFQPLNLPSGYFYFSKTTDIEDTDQLTTGDIPLEIQQELQEPASLLA